MTAARQTEIDADHAGERSRGEPGRAFATIEVHGGFQSVEPLWRSMLDGSLATAYQKPAFLKAWLDHAAGPAGVSAAIVVARDGAGRPVALLPFGVKRKLSVRIASFLGGSHSNFNVPVIRLDALSAFTPAECRRLLKEAARKIGADVVVLVNQPATWCGAANPFAALSGQPSADPAFSGPLAETPDIYFRQVLSAKTRSKQRRKLRRFEETGATRLYRAETPTERRRVLDAYLDQKRQQLAERGIASVFDKQGVREFLEAACAVEGGTAAVDLYGFELDGAVIAVTGVLPQGVRLSGMLNSIMMGENAKYSPGELLLGHVVEDAIKRGFKEFDLGVGVAPYKRMFCPNVEQLQDTILGVTLQGRTAAAALATMCGLKTRIKSNRTAYGLVQRLRRLKSGRIARETAPVADGD